MPVCWTPAREGYAINLPPRQVAGRACAAPIVAVDAERGIVEAVKRAEDRSGDVVVRLYEAAGGRASARLSLGFATAGVQETDLLERPLAGTPRTELDPTGR